MHLLTPVYIMHDPRKSHDIVGFLWLYIYKEIDKGIKPL